MDPLSALSVAAAVVQFVDFGSRILHDTIETYKSSAGQSSERLELSKLASELSALASEVEKRSIAAGKVAKGSSEQIFFDLCRECKSVSEELQTAVAELSAEGEKKKGFDRAKKSLVVTIKAIWSEDKIEKAKTRLVGIREQIVLAVLLLLWDGAQQNEAGFAKFTKQQEEILQGLNQIIESTRSLRAKGMTVAMRGSEETSQMLRQTIKTTWRSKVIEDPLVTGLSAHPMSESEITKVNESIISSLLYDTIGSREASISEAHQKTLRWIFEQPRKGVDEKPSWSSFPDWLESQDKDIYWITGKPGAGKSTLIRFIIQEPALRRHLSKWANGLPLVLGGFYFWNAGTSLQTSQDGLLRTLLYQCMTQKRELVASIIPRRYSLLQVFGTDLLLPDWELEELLDCFLTLVSTSGSSFKLAFMIDGLDEFEGDHKALVKLIQTASSHDGVKICVASRPWNVFNDSFSRNPQLKLEDLTRSDMEAFVQHKFASNEGFQEQKEEYPEEAGTLLRDIVDKAQGVFLWVDLVVQSLLNNLTDGNRFSEVRMILDDLPDDLSRLYENIWARIDSKYLSEASEYLQVLELTKKLDSWLSIQLLWLTHEDHHVTFNVCTVADSALKGALKNTLRRLNSRTKNLLEVYPGQRVDYLHRTARDWVLANWERIHLAGPADLDPSFILLKAATIQVSGSVSKTLATVPMSSYSWEKRISFLAQCACSVRNQDDARFFQLLDQVDVALSVSSSFHRCCPNPVRDLAQHHNCFISFCAQLPLSGYVRTKIQANPELVKGTFPPHTVLESAARMRKEVGGVQCQFGEDRIALVDLILQNCTYTSTYMVSLTDMGSGGSKNLQDLADYYVKVNNLLRTAVIGAESSRVVESARKPIEKEPFKRFFRWKKT